MSRNPEVIVAGGGPAGATAALVLARRGRRVLLVCGSGGEFRVGESIPPAVTPLLRDLGILEQFRADAHIPCYGNVSVWGSEEPTTTDFIYDVNGHGWHLDRSLFDATLRDFARDAGVEVLSDTRLKGAIRDGMGWQVTLASHVAGDIPVSCDWLIDATGRRALIARLAGAARRRHDLLVAFYARFRSTASTDRDSRTMVESAPDGWWYTALLPSGERVVAFLSDTDLVNRASLLSTTGFTSRLDSSCYIRRVLAAHSYGLISAVRGAEACTARLDHVAATGWAAIGDAAISLDPLSSQGILTALFTGFRAGQSIDRALAGDPAALEEYTRQVDEIARTYHVRRDAYYAAEGRWPDHEFWSRRRRNQVKFEGPLE